MNYDALRRTLASKPLKRLSHQLPLQTAPSPDLGGGKRRGVMNATDCPLP